MKGLGIKQIHIPEIPTWVNLKYRCSFFRHSMLRFDVSLHNSPVIPWPKYPTLNTSHGKSIDPILFFRNIPHFQLGPLCSPSWNIVRAAGQKWVELNSTRTCKSLGSCVFHLWVGGQAILTVNTCKYLYYIYILYVYIYLYIHTQVHK